jgi:long-chain acyl-CoA synthetase
MPTIPEIFEAMPGRYRPGSCASPRSYYFSIGEHKCTVRLTAEDCRVEDGKTLDHADVVLKTTPDLFERMVIRGEMPGFRDVTLGRIKTNDPSALADLKGYFRFDR